MADPFDYLGMRDDADSLFADMGQALIIRRTTQTGGTAIEPVQSTTDYATNGIVTELPRWYPAFTEGGVTDILRTDRLAIVAAGPLTLLGVTPVPVDSLVLADGTVFRVIDVKPVYPAGVTVAYKLQLRV